jgi:16S rRNA (guanine(966)-N(2))-methyltransferase RsmD
MRIIAGEFRGRALLAPESDTTRPITDRAKQSLFDVLTPIIPDAIVFDCFCGTGSMGLECLSRGAGKAVFFERDRSALDRLKKNIDTLGVRDRCLVSSGDIFKTLDSVGALPADLSIADLVFLDPPYRFLVEQPDRLRALAERLVGDHMKPDATLVFRHDLKDALELPRLTRYDQREYGQMAIELLRPTRP